MTSKVTIILTATSLTVFGATFFSLKNNWTTNGRVTENQTTLIESDSNITNIESNIQADTIEKFEKVKTTTEQTQNDLFRFAYEEIKDMLESKTKKDFKRAVFLVDNAYMNGTLDWNWYDNEIKNKLTTFEKMIQTSGYSRYKTSKNWAIHTYMTDTTVTRNGYQRYHYDYSNYTNDTTGLVYHLLQTKLGNCRSLPYLYKIFCDEFGATAFLATAPMHVYVRQQDENGIWWNLELTSFYKYMPSEDYIAQLQITETARQSGLYMKPLSEEENLALCLDDLLRYYIERKNIVCDPFVEEVLVTALNYMPISEMQLKRFSCLKQTLDLAMEKKGLNDYSKIKGHSELTQQFEAMDKVGRYIDKIGYKKISEELYQTLTDQSKKKAETHSQNKKQ
jgi:hypothetical protein